MDISYVLGEKSVTKSFGENLGNLEKECILEILILLA